MRIAIFLTALMSLPGFILLGTETLAQDNDQDPVALPTRYEVELIIFRHLDQSRNTAEIPAPASMIHDSPFELNLATPPVEQDPRAAGGTARAQQNGTTAAEDELGAGAGMQPSSERRDQGVDFLVSQPGAEFPDFAPFKEESFTLNGVYNRISRLEAYEPLAHLGWVQPAKNTEQAIPYQIANQSDLPRGITGTVTLYKERYLHLALDLALESRPSDEAAAPAAEIPPERVFGLSTSVDEPTRRANATHRLQQSRRVRVSNTHYFDHPLFGVIAKINVIETASGPDGTQPDPG